jgi:DNA-binding transcriptional regulator YiaG
MKYESDIYDSDIAEMIHENALLEFQLGLLSEAQMRKYDKLCLTRKALKNKTAQSAAANIAHADLITA